MVDKKAETINLKAKSKKEFLLLHGYTGSPTDFNSLPQYLHEKFNANVKVLRFVGHGTKVQDLDKLENKDFLKQVEREVKKDLKKGREIMVVGYSYGAQLALYLAEKYPLKGIVIISIAYKFKFPFNLSLIEYLSLIIKYYRKLLPWSERKLRENSFYYKYMPSKVLRMIRELNEKIEKILKNVTCPVLDVYAKRERYANCKYSKEIQKKVSSKIFECEILPDLNHNLFYSRSREMLYLIIERFVRKHNLF